MMHDDFATLDLSRAKKQDLRQVARELVAGRLVLFVGAGFSMNAVLKRGGARKMPSWGDLSKKLVDRLGEDFPTHPDPLRVADYYETRFGRTALVQAIDEIVQDDLYEPGRLHRMLPHLELAQIITTNFDTLIERSFRLEGIEPHVVASSGSLVQGRRSPRIIKMHGCLKLNPQDIVIAGSDFLAFPEKFSWIQAFVTNCFVESTVLFVGFGLNDPDFLAINERVLGTLGSRFCRLAYSFQFGANDSEVEFWKTRRIQIIDLLSDRGNYNYEEILYQSFSALLHSQDSVASGASALGRVSGLEEKVLEQLQREIPGWDPLALAQVARDSSYTQFTDLLHVLDGGQESSADAQVLKPVLRLLCALSYLSSPLVSQASETQNRALREVFIAMEGMGEWDFSFVMDRSLLAWGFTLLTFFAPLDRLSGMVSSWTDGSILPTVPEDLRLLPLSFLGILHKRSGLIRSAAESLWIGTESDFDRGRRFRYLRQVAPGRFDEWARNRLYHERLARVLATLALELDPQPSKYSDTMFHLWSTLQEVRKGWLFGEAPPISLERVWASVSLRPDQDRIPWEFLILITLPIEGIKTFERWGSILDAACRKGHIRLDFLVRMVIYRLGSAQQLGMHPGSPLELYEQGVARLLWWLGERLVFEPLEGIALGRTLTQVVEPISLWLTRTNDRIVEQSLLQALAAIGRWNRESVRPAMRRWVSYRSSSSLRLSSLQLGILDPEPHKPIVSTSEIELLLGFASTSEAAGRSFQNDLIRWVIDCSESNEIDDATVSVIGREVARRLKPDAWNFEWLQLAARLQVRPRIRAAAEQRLTGSTAPGLASFVRSTLLATPSRLKRHFDEKGIFLELLQPFVSSFDEELSCFIEPAIQSPLITPSGRDGAAYLLASLLKDAPLELRLIWEGRWKAILQDLLRQGATGRGLSSELLVSLDADAQRALQDNLLLLFEKDKAPQPPRLVKDDVSQVEAKIRLGDSIPFSDLEELLIQSIQSLSEAKALYSLEAVVRLMRDFPGFRDRQQLRIRRICLLVERLGNFRKPSRYAELLDELRQAGSRQQTSWPVTSNV